MPAVTKEAIHNRIYRALGKNVLDSGPAAQIPFRLQVSGLGFANFYAFTMTSPPGGRPEGEFKIQLIVPGQAKRQRGGFKVQAGELVLIVGWSEEEQVFALWDAYAHTSFAYSQNLQVKGQDVWRARTTGITECERKLRGNRGVEHVLICGESDLYEALQRRVQLSAERQASVLNIQE